MDINNIIYFLISAIILTVMPGPDIIYVTIQSISNGRKYGIITALGLCTGVLIHSVIAAIGVSALLRSSDIAYTILRFAGAGYLFYMAYGAYKSRFQNIVNMSSVNTKKGLDLYRQGVIMSSLNPKLIIFYLTFLPQFVTVGGLPNIIQILILGAIFAIQALAIFSVVSIFTGYIGEKLLNSNSIGYKVAIIKVLVFVIIGLLILFME